MKRTLYKILFLIIALLVLTACSQNKISSGDYQLDIPSPTNETAVVYGRIFVESTGEPTLGVPYLADLLTDENSTLPPTISFSYSNNKSATIDFETGEFYFDEMSPDQQYAIVIIYGPGNAQIVKEEDGVTPLIVQVNAGDSIDLGDLFIEE